MQINKKDLINTILICGGVVSLGYLAKKVYDLDKELKKTQESKSDTDIATNDKTVMENNPIEMTENPCIIKNESAVEIVDEEPLPLEIVNKIVKLEDTLTYEELGFNSIQRDYLNYIIDFMRKNREMRMALLISMNYNGKNPLEVFTDDQFNRIKRVLQT